MPKYVCDYEQVASAGEKIVEGANDLAQSTTTYTSNLSEDISTWDGLGRASFATTNNTEMQVVASRIIRTGELGEFVKEIPKQIKELDEELAATKI